MEDQSPYQASHVAPRTAGPDRRDEAPREITSPIKHMYVLVAVMGLFTATAAGFMVFAGPRQSLWMILPLAFVVGIYFLAAFGVYKRSRVAACAVLAMCGLSALGALANIANGQGSLSGIGFLAVLTFVSIRGTLATFRYHRHLRDVRSRPPRTRLSDDPAFAPKVDIAG
ncbi:hypothetical protein J7J08_01535 [Stenotrophomonas sp. ISL-67]|uniref:hypothetical protein n=1 Tax=Stenotrophomonas sp. ISL-67 TaxID=2819171 RepID=UPI001BE9E33B|nr:hypothetical protein [Stenotrophomonas sp. ISL-67]MBT2766317.1 hypothetical protein [Stenotrophomonas sp. ISL-67]